MTSRRDFMKTGAMATMGVSLGYPHTGFGSFGRPSTFESKRPKIGERNFASEAVEATIQQVKKHIASKELAWIFENCYPNTLDTTVKYSEANGKPDTFVITGDIHAMWLRDSTAQVWPYLPLAKEDPSLQKLLLGVVNRQTRCILIDPYANAFNDGPDDSPWKDDLTEMKPELHERKWEIDSLCYAIRLAHGYWKNTGDTTCFDQDWQKAMKLVLRTFREQQRKTGQGPYKFQRVTGWQTDTVAGAGYGNPIKPVGLICSIFRPSDDATIYPFLVPSNHFAVASLRQLAAIYEEVIGDGSFAKACQELALEVEKALRTYALAEHLSYGRIHPYEVDGFGNQLFMDDANIPSLLALPYLGCCDQNDPVYQNTRRFVLSADNPYFFKGTAGEGIGGPHIGLEMIWPMSIIMRALTSYDDKEIKYCIDTLVATHGGTGFMHESFHQDQPTKFTRKWFAWANTLFGELIIKTYHKKPYLLES